MHWLLPLQLQKIDNLYIGMVPETYLWLISCNYYKISPYHHQVFSFKSHFFFLLKYAWEPLNIAWRTRNKTRTPKNPPVWTWRVKSTAHPQTHTTRQIKKTHVLHQVTSNWREYLKPSTQSCFLSHFSSFYVYLVHRYRWNPSQSRWGIRVRHWWLLDSG